MQAVTLIAPTCQCCAQRQTLAPRNDLGGGMAVCPQSGQLYRSEGQTYVPTQMPELRRAQGVAPQTIDLSQVGYS